ncbi:MAG: mobile mystery protein B [Phycisphaerales bacterium]
MPSEGGIPGQTPIDDLSGLRDRSLRTQSQLNEAEAESIRRALVRHLLGPAPDPAVDFDVSAMRALHRSMFGRVWEWAGQIRRRELNIGSPPGSIEVDLNALAEDLQAWRAGAMPLEEQAARLHHRAVQIHPFQNGNGRWARLLANLWLRAHGAPLVEWPDAAVGAESVVRADYLRALRAADLGDLAPLRAMHRAHTPPRTDRLP